MSSIVVVEHAAIPPLSLATAGFSVMPSGIVVLTELTVGFWSEESICSVMPVGTAVVPVVPEIVRVGAETKFFGQPVTG